MMTMAMRRRRSSGRNVGTESTNCHRPQLQLSCHLRTRQFSPITKPITCCRCRHIRGPEAAKTTDEAIMRVDLLIKSRIKAHTHRRIQELKWGGGKVEGASRVEGPRGLSVGRECPPPRRRRVLGRGHCPLPHFLRFWGQNGVLS